MYLAQLTGSDQIKKGEKYSFTFDSGEFFVFSSEKSILDGLKKYLAPYADVLSVSRPLMSNRYIVVIVPKLSGSLPVWEGIFKDAWHSINFDEVTLLQAEGGTKSTQPGGLPQVGIEIGGAVGEAAKGVVTPLAPYLLIGLVGYLGILFMQRRQ
jgi:hypothetical protein